MQIEVNVIAEDASERNSQLESRHIPFNLDVDNEESLLDRNRDQPENIDTYELNIS